MARTQGNPLKHKRIQTQHNVKNDDAIQHLLQQLMQEVVGLHAKVDTLSNKLGIPFQEPVQTQAELFMREVQDQDDLDSVSELSQHSTESDNSGHVIVTMPGGSKVNRHPGSDMISCGLTSNDTETSLISEKKKNITTFINSLSPNNATNQRDLNLASPCSGHATDSDDSGYVLVAFPGGHFEPQSEGNRGLTTPNSEITAPQLTSNSPEQFNTEQKKKKKRTTYVRKEESTMSDSRQGTGQAVGHIDSLDDDFEAQFKRYWLNFPIDIRSNKQAWTFPIFDLKVRDQRDSNLASEWRYTTKSEVSECGNFEPQRRGHRIRRRLDFTAPRQNRFKKLKKSIHYLPEISEVPDYI